MQFVDFDETNSDMLDITTGLPQGSILGPLLIIINIFSLFAFYKWMLTMLI